MIVSVEGIDGAGKSTAIRLLAGQLTRAKRKVKVLAPLSNRSKIAKLALQMVTTQAHCDPKLSLMMICAAHRELLVTQINPLLKEGVIVFIDRFIDSTRAYQSICSGLSLEHIQSQIDFALDGFEPQLTLIIDCFATVAKERLLERENGKLSGFEVRPLETQERLRRFFLNLAVQDKRYKIIFPETRKVDMDRVARWIIAQTSDVNK